MRVLTVRQPWAWAIIHAGKDVENRVRNLAGSYRGPVAIHSGLAPFEQHNIASQEHARLHGGETSTVLHFGAIIGVVDLVDVHVGSQFTSQWCGPMDGAKLSDRCSAWGEDGTFHLVLKNPRPLATPIPFKGALGLRTLDGEIAAAILREVR